MNADPCFLSNSAFTFDSFLAKVVHICAQESLEAKPKAGSDPSDPSAPIRQRCFSRRDADSPGISGLVARFDGAPSRQAKFSAEFVLESRGLERREVETQLAIRNDGSTHFMPCRRSMRIITGKHSYHSHDHA